MGEILGQELMMLTREAGCRVARAVAEVRTMAEPRRPTCRQSVRRGCPSSLPLGIGRGQREKAASPGGAGSMWHDVR